ncbi:hypothetical protein [Raoultella terrigena]|uniref:hypothetical protein n=1 Tax=Raoultella terrigena TaxID=577 RepID=UPI000F4CEFB7|nr:hypothetical protein [Raoultella terrigena]ROS02157.1 hypothetical protein EDF76_0127 [Raoultella terrigena]
MDDEKLRAYLKAIGMGCFVTYYDRFASAAVSRADLIELLHTQEGYTEKSGGSRTSKARAIIAAGASEEALRLIIASNRVNDDLRNAARKLLMKNVA